MSNTVRNLVKSRDVGTAPLDYVYKGETKTKTIGTAARKSVLLAMADRAKDDGTKVYLALDTIADETGFSAKGVWQAIKTLKADGLIKVTAARKLKKGWQDIVAVDLKRVEALPLTSSASKPVEKVIWHPVQEPEAPGAINPPHPVPTIHPFNDPLDVRSAEKRESPSEVVQYAREEDDFDHLAGDANFATFMEEQKARSHG